MDKEPNRIESDAQMWFVARFWNWVDKHQADRQIAFYFTLWMTYQIVDWAMNFVDIHPDKPGLETAAILAAVMTPWSAFQAAVFKFYSENRESQQT